MYKAYIIIQYLLFFSFKCCLVLILFYPKLTNLIYLHVKHIVGWNWRVRLVPKLFEMLSPWFSHVVRWHNTINTVWIQDKWGNITNWFLKPWYIIYLATNLKSFKTQIDVGIVRHIFSIAKLYWPFHERAQRFRRN